MQPNFNPQRRMLRRLHRARAGLFAVAVIFCALLALAAPIRTPRPRRPLAVQQPQGSAHAGAKAKSGRSGGRSLKKPPTHTQSSETQSPSGGKSHRAAPHAAPPARHRTRPDADNPDPATMVRTRSHRVALPAPTKPVYRHTLGRDSAAEARRAAAQKSAERAAAQKSAQLAAARESAQLAAGIEASVLQARARAQRPAPPRTAVEAAVQPPAPVVRVPPASRLPRRVDGFGAEGANLTVAGPPAGYAPPPTPVYTDSADSADLELEALAHPTRSQLTEEAVQPHLLPRIDSVTGHLLMPAPLRGSREVLVHQNVMADDEGLSRIQNDAELNHLRALRLLVDFPVSESLRLNPELPASRRCARPWTVRFAADIAHAFYARFHQPLQVNSAARTVAYQLRLQRSNGNAAAVEGEAASPHLTGQAIDFGKRGMSAAQLAWMRATLLPLMSSGKIDVEEEFQQACFHISVYRSYLPPARKRALPRPEVAQLHPVE